MAGKTYTVEEKYNIIFESISTNQAITEICRKHGISPSTYQIWKDQFITGARSGLEGKSRKSPYEKQVEDLKATIADLAKANDALKLHKIIKCLKINKYRLDDFTHPFTRQSSWQC